MSLTTVIEALRIRKVASVIAWLWLMLGFVGLLVPGQATAAAPGPAWEISIVPSGSEYLIALTNIGSVASSGTVTLVDRLPRGYGVTGRVTWAEQECSERTDEVTIVTCTYTQPVAPLVQTPVLAIHVVGGGGGPAPDMVMVSGGGALGASTSLSAEPGGPVPPFGFLALSSRTSDELGAPDTQAGGHPFALSTVLDISSAQIAKAMEFELPTGLSGDPLATPRCPIMLVSASACPAGSRVGTVFINMDQGIYQGENAAYPIYNVIPEHGYPAELGFWAKQIQKAVFAYASIGPGPDYNIRLSIPDIPASGTVTSVIATFFGDPESMDNTSGVGENQVNPSIPFFTEPSDCSGASLLTTARMESWERPGLWVPEGTPFAAQALPVAGCDRLQFRPEIAVKAETTGADEPTGYGVDLHIPQSQSTGIDGLATPDLKSTTVTLPAGISLDPAAADGLAACPAEGPQAINITGPESEENGPNGEPRAAPGHCPLASQVGTVEAVTPVLSEPLQGHLYVAQPGCGESGQSPCTETNAANGSLFGFYLELNDPSVGVVIKSHGTASVNPANGQVMATFTELPQQPVGDVRVTLKGGPRAPLSNPQACGEALTTTDIAPWSAPETPDAHPISAFIVSGCEGSPFAPSFLAGTINTAGGAYTEFSTTFSRADRMQDLGAIQVHTPAGLLGMLAHVALCQEPQAAQGACSAASEIGTVSASAGAGSHPYWVSGKVYVTGPYEGAPFGLSIVLPAKAGPFNLGTVVTRATLNADPTTAALTVTSGPLPQIIDGVPLRVQNVNVTINRPQFMFNPTDCAAQQITGTIASAQGTAAQVSSPFAAGGCKNLPFDPGFTVATRTPAAKDDGAELDVKVTSAAGQANIHSIAVALPKRLPSRLKTIQQACLDTTFDTNPAACPHVSLIGVARAVTPVLSTPLTGPAYLVSHGGAAFPDVDIVLQGEGVRLDLTGSINISKSGVTSSTFASIPDAPVSSFELQLPEGPYSALTTNGSLCAKALTMPTTIVGQNGRRLVRTTKVAVSGCPRTKGKAKKKTTKKSRARAGRTGNQNPARSAGGGR